MKTTGGTGSGGLTKPVAGAPLSKEVLEKVNRRDPEALGSLFDVYFRRIYNLAYRLLGNRSGAEDVSQEVFLRVYKAAHQLDAKRDPGPWLMTITANLCREQWRSRSGKQDQRTSSLDAKPELSLNLTGGDEASRAAEAGDRDAHLFRAMAELPQEMREVVVLHDLQGVPHSEIAAMMSLEAATVRKRYSRALQKMRESLPEGLL